MTEQWIERYRKPTRILHWVNTGCFIVLFITGLILYLPPFAILAQDGWTRVIHRVASIVIIVGPLVYFAFNFKSSLKGMSEAFNWGMEDIGWLLAAPKYYFLADEKSMPPQEHMNTGQKMWWLLVIMSGFVFLVTGIIMWAFKTSAPTGLLQWSVFAHDIAFIVTACMFFLHVYLSVIHPLMKGSWDSMSRGKVSAEYARSHHAKWYEKVALPNATVKGVDAEWKKATITK